MRYFARLMFGLIWIVAAISNPLCVIAQSTLIRPPNPQEPGWEGRILLFGEERARIKSMPIEVRPNRVGHFYGNSVRRIYYRGSIVPLPRDFINMAYAAVRER